MIGSIANYLASNRDNDEYRVGGAASDAVITDCELALGVKFSSEYREFAKEVGWLEVDNTYLFGVNEKDGTATGEGGTVRMTKYARETWGLPGNLYVVYSSDDAVLWCIDGSVSSRASKVIAYDTRKKKITGTVANSFDEALTEFFG
jgi:hypothetical protein